MSPENKTKLAQLLDKWAHDTMPLSSAHQIMAHPNVAAIREEFGMEYMPFLLKYLAIDSSPGLMSLIIQMSNGEIKLKEEQRGVHCEILREILKWGQVKGFIGNEYNEEN